MLRVLFIRDRSTENAPLEAALERLGLDVHYETPAQFEALDRWDEPLDLLILDLDMQELPGRIRGWDMLHIFREYNHSGTEPKVLVMTVCNETGSHLLDNINAVHAYLLKPVQTDVFVAAVQRLLRLKGASAT